MQENFRLVASLAGCDISVKEEEEEDTRHGGEEGTRGFFLERVLFPSWKAYDESFCGEDPCQEKLYLLELFLCHN
ncbi:hypothetical protein JD844_003887, partial [Phrynosoma platyrhinos]